MALDAKKRQKKLEKKNKKRKDQKKSSSALMNLKDKITRYAKYPIHECLVPEDIFELGKGMVVITRLMPGGDIAVGSFLVDKLCLGVKDAFFTTMSELSYENQFKIQYAEQTSGLLKVEPEYARKLIEGAVEYAAAIGLPPHPDYGDVRCIFGDIDPEACPEVFEYGENGKPLYVRGPNESEFDANLILNHLTTRLGKDNFHYIVGMGDEDDGG